ncbi:outer membrane beta-barrel protein [Fibrella arboris]|uniref:outer membrane beta-barrel protein n=1 Tax=Fibrella arboris TaxID=3242486 RepID=UPI0035201FD4
MRNYLLLVFFLISGSLLAQRASTAKIGVIKGLVIDSTSQKALLEANVSLLNARDSSFVQLQSTGGEGDFTLTGITPGAYRLLISFVGYRTKTFQVTITPDKPEVVLGTILVQPQAQNLGEVVIVQERPPVSVRGDTVAFNASSFKTQPNAQAEDLLKKMPGMEVDRDGNVKAQGQDVRRILVDGKPFFGNDPKMATRNLPADMIERVEVFDRQSDQSQFSGVDDGERDRTINLVTKRDRRRGVFGQQSVGYGTDDRYQGRISVNRFNNGQQLSAIGQLNNINQQGFTGEGLSNGGGGGGNAGGGRATTGTGQTQGSGLAGPTGITRAGAAGLNFSDALGTKIDISSSYFFNQTNVLNQQASRRETSLPATTAGGERTQNFTDRTNGSMALTNSHRFNVQLNYRLDSANSIRVIPNFTYSLSNSNTNSDSRTTDGAGQPLNTSLSLYNSDGKSLSGSNTLLWMHKFKRRGRTFSANLITTVNDNTTNSLNQSQNQFFRSTSTGAGSSTLTGGGSSTLVGGTTNPFSTSINQQARQLTNALTNNLTLSYTEPLSLAKTLEFRYNLSLSNNESDKRTNDLNPETGQYDRLNVLLTNKFNNTFITNRVGTSYQYRRLKYQYTLGFDFQNASLKSDNLSRDTTVAKMFQNVLPNARFQYTIARGRTFTADYRTRVNAPSVTQLQPIIDNSNPLNIRSGNPNLRPEYTHTLNLNYRTFDQTTFKNFVASVGLTSTYNRIVNATTITPAGAQVSQPINTDGYYSVFAFTSFGKPMNWGEQKINVNWTSSLNGSRGVSLVNGQSNTSVNMNIGQGLSLNTNINEKTDLNLSGNVTYSIATYSIQPQQNTRYLTNTANLRAFHRFGNRFFVQTDLYYNGNTGRAAGYNQQFVLLNASIGQFLFKQKQGEWRISGYDLLNQNRSITRTTSETYIEDTQSLVLRRYFMLTFSYSIRYFAAMRATP